MGTPRMSALTDKPMARASAHLAAGRFAEAVGAFRAVLHIDPNEFRAHLGIADATAARGDRDGAIEALVEGAQEFTEAEHPEAAMALYGRVLVLDPNRIEVHLDIAFAESALGRHDDALARVEGLAEAYLRGGRSDEAEELFRFAASWEPDQAHAEAEAPPPAEPTPPAVPHDAGLADAAPTRVDRPAEHDEPPHPAFADFPVHRPPPEPVAPMPMAAPSPALTPASASASASASVQGADEGAQWRLPLGTAPEHFESRGTPTSLPRRDTMPFYVARPGESTGEVPRLPADLSSGRATLVPTGAPDEAGVPAPRPEEPTLVGTRTLVPTQVPTHAPDGAVPHASGMKTVVGTHTEAVWGAPPAASPSPYPPPHATPTQPPDPSAAPEAPPAPATSALSPEPATESTFRTVIPTEAPMPPDAPEHAAPEPVYDDASQPLDPDGLLDDADDLEFDASLDPDLGFDADLEVDESQRLTLDDLVPGMGDSVTPQSEPSRSPAPPAPPPSQPVQAAPPPMQPAAPPPPQPAPPPPPAPPPQAAAAPEPEFPTTPEGIVAQVGPPPGIAPRPAPPPKPKPAPVPPPESSTPTLAVHKRGLQSDTPPPTPSSTPTLAASAPPGARPVATPSSTPTISARAVPPHPNAPAAPSSTPTVAPAGYVSPDVTQKVPRLPDDLSMAPPAQAPVEADPWINDPRAAPGGTVVAKVPDGFFEAMASGDPERIAKLRLQDSRGKPLQTDAAAFRRPAAPSLRRPGDAPRDGGRKPRVNKRVVGGSRSAPEPAKPASRPPAGPKKVSSSGWTISSGQRRKNARIEDEPVDAPRPRSAANKAAAKPAPPAPAPEAAAEPDLDAEATVAKAVAPPPEPQPKPQPEPRPKPRPKAAKPARPKTGKTSSLVARLRQRAGLESPDERRSKRAEPSEAAASDEADDHTVARAHPMPEDEQTRIAARDDGDDENTRIAATPDTDEESTRIANRAEVERRPDPGLDAPTQNMVVDEAFTRVANPGLDGPTQNIAPLDDESTRVGRAPGGADGPTHDIELDDDEFEALQTEVVDKDDDPPDAPDDRTVARAVPERDDAFEDDQRTRLFRREDDE